MQATRSYKEAVSRSMADIWNLHVLECLDDGHAGMEGRVNQDMLMLGDMVVNSTEGE